MWPNLQLPLDLITFNEEISNGKLYFCAERIIPGFKSRPLLQKTVAASVLIKLQQIVEGLNILSNEHSFLH